MGLIRHVLMQRGLDEDEKRVVKLLWKGEMKQKELMKKLDVNPVKFNKLLRSLEEKKILKREPRGRENVVRLL